MKKMIIIHGTKSSSQANWFPWLKSELEKKQVQVWSPNMPNADNPSSAEWTEFVIKNCPFPIDSETTLVGHSTGAVVVLFIAQKLGIQIEKVLSVGAYKDNKFLKWEANNRVFDMKFDFVKIKNNCTNIVFIHSDNDPYCPLEHAEYLASKTGGKLIVMPGQGHFSASNDPRYTKFLELLDLL